MNKQEINDLLDERETALEDEKYDGHADDIQSMVLEAVQKNFDSLEIDFIIESCTRLGWAPNLMYDDNGHFAVSCDGMNEVSEGKLKDTSTFMVIIEPEYWKDNIREAVKYFLENV